MLTQNQLKSIFDEHNFAPLKRLGENYLIDGNIKDKIISAARISKDDLILVDRQPLKDGKEITLDKVLLVSKDKKVEVGQPYLKNVKVSAEVLSQVKGEKTTAFKYRRRKSSHWEKGHRAKLTELKIKSIEIGAD